MIELDAQKLTDRESSHGYLQQMLSFPAYYGRNLDALFDELTSGAWTVQFVGVEKAGCYFDTILRIFQDAAAQNPALIISIQETIQ